jgi:small subunit ribosomal protein S16
MAVKIRMKRTGTTNDACFRVVAADMRSPRDGRNLETLGWYDPSAKGKMFDLKLDRIDYWLGVGAQISDTVSSLVKKSRKAAAAAKAESGVTAPGEAPAAAADAN